MIQETAGGAMRPGRLGRPLASVCPGAENLSHHADQLEQASICDTVENPVGVFARVQNPLVAKDRQMLRDVALRRPDLVDDVLDADLIVTKGAEDLQSEGMGDGFQRARRTVYISVGGEKFHVEFIVGDHTGKLFDHSGTLQFHYSLIQ